MNVFFDFTVIQDVVSNAFVNAEILQEISVNGVVKRLQLTFPVSIQVTAIFYNVALLENYVAAFFSGPQKFNVNPMNAITNMVVITK
jgi:hypothetical protein